MVRRRTTPARRSRSLLRTSVVAAVIVGAVVATLPAASFSTSSLDRETNIAVSSDVEGVLGLDIATSIQKKQDGQLLLQATNHFDEPLTVTVALEDESDSTVYFDNSTSSPENSVTVAPTTTESAFVDEAGETGNTYPLNFFISAAGPGLYVEANRTTTVEAGGGNGNGNGNGNN